MQQSFSLYAEMVLSHRKMIQSQPITVLLDYILKVPLFLICGLLSDFHFILIQQKIAELQ